MPLDTNSQAPMRPLEYVRENEPNTSETLCEELFVRGGRTVKFTLRKEVRTDKHAAGPFWVYRFFLDNAKETARLHAEDAVMAFDRFVRVILPKRGYSHIE